LPVHKKQTKIKRKKLQMDIFSRFWRHHRFWFDDWHSPCRCPLFICDLKLIICKSVRHSCSDHFCICYPITGYQLICWGTGLWHPSIHCEGWYGGTHSRENTLHT
jgi:hypothetical protein